MRTGTLIMLTASVVLLSTPLAAHTLVVAKVEGGCIVQFEGGFRVHLTGITVPGPETEVGWAAYDYAKRRLEGTRVAVFTWTTDNTAAGIVCGDDGLAFAKIMYGRGLSIDIAAELLERGLARVDTERLPDGCEHYREIERDAKARGLGLWSQTD